MNLLQAPAISLGMNLKKLLNVLFNEQSLESAGNEPHGCLDYTQSKNDGRGKDLQFH